MFVTFWYRYWSNTRFNRRSNQARFIAGIHFGQPGVLAWKLWFYGPTTNFWLEQFEWNCWVIYFYRNSDFPNNTQAFGADDFRDFKGIRRIAALSKLLHFPLMWCRIINNVIIHQFFMVVPIKSYNKIEMRVWNDTEMRYRLSDSIK